jgi:hypothetical protein
MWVVICPLSPLSAQGNAALVRQRLSHLQALGVETHLVVSTPERIGAGDRTRLSRLCSTLTIHADRAPKDASGLWRNRLDDWFSEELSEILTGVFRQDAPTAVFANYIWMSAAFDLAPRQAARILETHDLFGYRDLHLAEGGMVPAWYAVDDAEEDVGFARASHIVAIQGAEASRIAARTRAKVHTVGYAPSLDVLPHPRPNGQLRVGYLASDNLTNRASIGRFIDAADSQGLGSRAQLVCAGPICRHLPDRPWIRRLGLVDSATDLYREVDCALNPDLGGTGLKIKSVEALAHGMALVSTEAGAAGIDLSASECRCRTVEDVVAALGRLAMGSGLDGLRESCRSDIAAYVRRERVEFARLVREVGR